MPEKIKCQFCDTELTRSGMPLHVASTHRAKVAEALEALGKLQELTNTVEAQNSEIATLKETPVRSSIEDFPAEEQAAYFTNFLKTLDDSEKAILEEEVGIKFVTPAESRADEAATPPASQAADEIATLSDGTMAEFCVRSMRKTATGGDKEYTEMLIHGKNVVAKTPLTDLDITGTGFYTQLFNKVQGMIEKGRLKEEVLDAPEENRQPVTVLVIGNQKFVMKRREEPAQLEERRRNPRIGDVTIEIIHESLVNGQRVQMVDQIKRYGVYDFWPDYKDYLADQGAVDLKTAYDHFTDAVISYFRIKK